MESKAPTSPNVKPVAHGATRAGALDRIAHVRPDVRVVGHTNGRPILDFGDHQATMDRNGVLHPIRSEVS